MFAFIRKSGHVVWRKRWYAFTLRLSLRVDLYMTRKDQVFVANVVVIDATQKIMASSVTSWLIGVVVKLNAITKICKLLQEGHHLILMAMKVHNAPKCDMDCFIRECARLFHDKWSRGHLSLSFCIQFFKQHVNIAFQCALVSIVKRKIALTSDAYFRPLTPIRSHNLHVGDIRITLGEIASYHKRN